MKIPLLCAKAVLQLLAQAAFLKQLDAHVFPHSLASLERGIKWLRDRISLCRASPPLVFEALRKHSTAYRR